MGDYIRREDAVDAVNHALDRETILFSFVRKVAISALKRLPPADVAPVVRCDDCEYYGSRRWCELHSSVFDDNAFCSYGERRED